MKDLMYTEAIVLLKQLIETPSFSGEEEQTASIIMHHLEHKGIPANIHGNNVWAVNKHFDNDRYTILLNSHHDTVKPNAAYTLDPFAPIEKEGKIYGLGSNDAGGSLVALLTAFVTLWDQKLPFNLIFAATAEEEISGTGGIASLLPQLPKLDFAIVGEPTRLRLAIAEKGLMVIDATCTGPAGHSAHIQEKTAIEKAAEAILQLKKLPWRTSPTSLLGPVKTTVAKIQAGKQHNQVPADCHFVIDVRTNEAYSNQEAFQFLATHLSCKLEARSFRLNSSSVSPDHPFVKAAVEIFDVQTYGSPTLSDQSLLPFDSVKIGCGESSRSHSADEFIHKQEIEEGIDLYLKLLKNFSPD